MYFESSRLRVTVTVWVPAESPDTSIFPLNVEPDKLSISDCVPLTITLVLSVTKDSFSSSARPSYDIWLLSRVIVAVAFVSISISILIFDFAELTSDTPSGRYPDRSTDVFTSPVAPEISIGPTSIDVMLFKVSAAPFNTTDSSESVTPSTPFPPAGVPLYEHLRGTSLVLSTSTVTSIELYWLSMSSPDWSTSSPFSSKSTRSPLSVIWLSATIVFSSTFILTFADDIVETTDSGPPIFTTRGFAAGLSPIAFAPDNSPLTATLTSNCFCM